jgi:hypothetical protein
LRIRKGEERGFFSPVGRAMLCAIGALLVGGGERPAAPRAALMRMDARQRDALSRRELADGSALAKAFYDPDGFRAGLPRGWSPALVLGLGAAAAAYGGSARARLFDQIAGLGRAPDRPDAAARAPAVALAPAGAAGRVSLTLSAPELGGARSADGAVDYMWLLDADTREIVAGRRFTPSEPPSLTLLVERGRRLVPLLHRAAGDVCEGGAFVAE